MNEPERFPCAGGCAERVGLPGMKCPPCASAATVAAFAARWERRAKGLIL